MNPASAQGRTLRLGVLIASALLTAGCASTPGTGYEAGSRAESGATTTDETTTGTIGIVTVSDGVRIVHDDWAKLGYRWQWSTTPLEVGNGKVDSVDILGDVIAVQSQDSWTAMLQESTGNRLWQVRNTSALTSFVGNRRVGDVLLSCGRPEIFLMELASGNLIARQPVDVVVTTPPIMYGGLAVFGTPIGEVLCHRFGKPNGEPLPPPFDGGSKEWGYLLEGAITAAPVRIDRTAGIVTQSGEVFFVDIPTGSGVGRARISGGMATNPVTDGRLMYIASVDQSIYAFAPTDSTWRWRYRTASPLKTQPTWHDGDLYCHIPGEGLVAFDVTEEAQISGRFGEQRWTNPDVAGVVVAVRSGELVVWDGAHATLVDRVAGDILARIALPRITDLIPSKFEDGDIFAVSGNGLLAKFSPR